MLSAEEKGRFEKICEETLAADRTRGIGTLGEKTLHRVLKRFFCDAECVHEVKLGDFVADAVLGGVIYEIQTGGFFPLKKKLQYYKENTDYSVRIVCPVVKKKSLVWVDPESGEMSAPRRTNVGLGKWRVLAEMIYLLPIFDFSRTSLLLAELVVEDYKLLDGYGKDKKIRASRYERLPRELLALHEIKNRKDFAAHFLPELPEVFGSAEFSKKTGLRRRSLSAALKVLLTMDIVRIAGKERNKILYEKNPEA